MKVDMWYDRHVKSWCIQLKDEQDNQIGECGYVYTKGEAKRIKKIIEENIQKGIDIVI